MANRIGIPLIQGELNGQTGWVAGLYFIQNCLNAIASLAPNDIPEIILFIPEASDDVFLSFIEKIKGGWLQVVLIPQSNLTHVEHSEEVERIIQSYHCHVFFPLLTLPNWLLQASSIGWIPDFQDRYFKKLFHAEELLFRKTSSDFLVNYCERLICTSNAVFSDLEKFYPACIHKASIIHFRTCISTAHFSNQSDVLREYNIQKKYVYLPNQFWVHKNHKLVFEAWNQLRKSGCDYLLVCSGSQNDYRNKEYYNELVEYLNENELSGQIILLGFIDRTKQILTLL